VTQVIAVARRPLVYFTGEPRDAGILPRALDVLFNSINGKQQSGYDLKPTMFMDVVKLTKEEAEDERKVKGKTLKLSSDEVCSGSKSLSARLIYIRFSLMSIELLRLICKMFQVGNSMLYVNNKL
jgi:hypothetical protein